jgi:SAM-dependent methyltransferase
VKEALKRLGRTLLWPIRRFFDPRFQGVIAAVEANVQATIESTELLGRAIADVHASVQEANSRLINVQHEAEKASGAYFKRLLEGAPSDLDASAASLLSHEGGSRGFAAQSGLWFNPPISVHYHPGAVVLGGINERVAEIPYVFRGLADLGPGASILDVGATESMVALSLASLGYEVTALDPRPYPLAHPRLRSVVGTISEWNDDGTFDAVVCLSTIEHIGLEAYGVAAAADGADLAAMKRILELTAPGGRLLLTTRFGEAGVDELQRTYDRSGLDALLEGWKVQDLTFLRRADDATWVVSQPSEEPGAELVALVKATRPG